MGGGSSIHHDFVAEELKFDESELGRSSIPETWENRALAFYKAQFGEECYHDREVKQFPSPPRKTFLERNGLDIEILKIKSLMSAAAILRGQRPTHNIGLGGLGEGTVLDNPDIPKNEFFVPGSTFPIRIRHSNALGTYDHDGGFEPRGFAIKFADSTAATPCDIILNTGEMMGFFNVDTFSEFTSIQISGKDDQFLEFNRKYPSAFVAAINSYRRAPKSYHDLHYYSQVCFKFIAEDGKPRVCRFRAVPFESGPGTPVAPEQSGLPDLQDQRDAVKIHPRRFGGPRSTLGKESNYLHEEYRARVDGDNAKYRLQIQFRDAPEGCNYEIYNPNKPWGAEEFPFHDLMTLTIKSVLSSNETEQMCFHVNNLPTSTLAILPAFSTHDYNSVMVCRSKVYTASQKMRSLTRKSIPLPADVEAKTYVIKTKTYPKLFEGTSKPVLLSIIGTKGSTSAIQLNDGALSLALCPGAKNVFSVDAEDVGDVLAVRAEKATDDSDHWRVKSISVQCTSSTTRGPPPTVYFLCSRWVEFSSNYFYRCDKGVFVPSSENDVEAELRRTMLLANQQRWAWNKDSEGILPCHGTESSIFQLPIDHQFSTDRFVSFGLIDQEAKFNSFFAKQCDLVRDIWSAVAPSPSSGPSQTHDASLAYSTGRELSQSRILSIDDFSSPGLFALSKVPERSVRWRSDAEFADRMISGANPICLHNITSIPVNFNVTSAQVQHLMPTGATLESQLSAGLVFFIDHGPALDGIPLWTPELAKKIMSENSGMVLDESQRYAPPVQGLFHVHPDVKGRARLMPLAIQLLKGPSEAVYVPVASSDNDQIDLDWIVAKTFFMVSHAQVHQMVTHLFCTHLIMEPFVVAMERQLPSVHPVNKLLHHHVVCTVAINTFGRAVLIADGGLADVCLSVGGGGHIKMMCDYYKSGQTGNGLHFFTRFNHAKFCESRGVADSAKLPNYMYRDDGMKIWNAIQGYVTSFLELHYQNDDAVIADREVQNWVADLRENAFTASRVPDFPGSIPSLNMLVELVTILIFQLSCGHAAVNFSQWDEYAHIPTCPTSALRPPPTRPGEFSVDDFMDIFPSLSMVRQQIITAHTLGKFNSEEQFISDRFEDDIFSVEEGRVVAQFKDTLAQIDADMDARNRAAKAAGLEVSGDAYHYLKPSRVPNSIAI